MNHNIRLASTDDIQQLLPLIKDFHTFEDIQISDEQRKQAINDLLSDPSLGGIWLILADTTVAGYIALTFGYSIEFGGKDAFIDELYIRPELQGLGLGKQTLIKIQQEAKAQTIQAMHLEVARQNTKAQKLYAHANFLPRKKYMLMSVSLKS
ncbi:MAG: GNAT family N-acetyltransferase [Cyanobacteria bacterium P01_H01_bin.21]